MSGSRAMHNEHQISHQRHIRENLSSPLSNSKLNAGAATFKSVVEIGSEEDAPVLDDGRRLCDLLPASLFKELTLGMGPDELFRDWKNQLSQWDSEDVRHRRAYTELKLNIRDRDTLRNLNNFQSRHQFNDWLSGCYQSMTQREQSDKQRTLLEDRLLEIRHAIALLPVDAQDLVDWPSGAEQKLKDIENSRAILRKALQEKAKDQSRGTSSDSSQRSKSTSPTQDLKSGLQEPLSPMAKKQMQRPKRKTAQKAKRTTPSGSKPRAETTRTPSYEEPGEKMAQPIKLSETCPGERDHAIESKANEPVGWDNQQSFHHDITTFLRTVQSKPDQVRLKDHKENKETMSSEYVYERRDWIKEQGVVLKWAVSKASGVLVMKTQIPENDQSPVTLAGKELVHSYLSGDVEGIPMFLPLTAIRKLSLNDIFVQLFSQLLNDGRLQKKIREGKIDSLESLISSSKGDFDPGRWIRELCRQILNQFEIVFWIDSLHVVEGDEITKSGMDSLLRTFITLATKAKARFPLRLLVTCPCHSEILGCILDDSTLIPAVEVPSAAHFKAKYLKMQEPTKQSVQIRGSQVQHQLEIEGEGCSSDQPIRKADYEANDSARSRADILSGALNLHPDEAIDEKIFRWCLTRAKLRQSKAFQDKITGADGMSPKAQDRSKSLSAEDELMNDVKLISVQFKLVDDARRGFLSRTNCLHHLEKQPVLEPFDLSTHYGEARQQWFLNHANIHEWMRSKASGARIVNCFEPREIEGSPLSSLPGQAWFGEWKLPESMLIERLAFGWPGNTPKDVAVYLMLAMLWKSWDNWLPLPEGNPKFEELIKGVRDCLLRCLSRGAIFVHLHGFSIYEDNIDNIRGLSLLQSTLIKLTREDTKYPLKLVISNSASSKIANRLSQEYPDIPVVEVPNIEQWERDYPEDVPVAPPIPLKITPDEHRHEQ